jgi:Fe-S cluster biosynthesis and repair protein YggX
MDALLDAAGRIGKRARRAASNREAAAKWRKKQKLLLTEGRLEAGVVEARKQQKITSQNRIRQAIAREKKAAKEAAVSHKQKEQSEAVRSAVKVTLNSHAPPEHVSPHRE